jgi:hypothetical protein
LPLIQFLEAFLWRAGEILRFLIDALLDNKHFPALLGEFRRHDSATGSRSNDEHVRIESLVRERGMLELVWMRRTEACGVLVPMRISESWEPGGEGQVRKVGVGDVHLDGWSRDKRLALVQKQTSSAGTRLTDSASEHLSKKRQR